MRYIIIGPGALGSLLAARLGRRQEVWFLDHNSDRAARLAGQGLLFEKDGQIVRIPVRAVVEPDLLPAGGIILLCVKSHGVRAAIARAEQLISRSRLLITLQNGISHLDLLSEVLTSTPWAAGVTSMGANLIEPGRVRFGGEGLTRLGFLPGSGNDPAIGSLLARVAGQFRAAGLDCRISPAIIPHIWDKLLINCGINALTAIHNCRNGQLLDDPPIKETLGQAVLEGENLARAMGIEISPNPQARTLEVCRATSSNISSMLQDVRSRKSTEIAAINGAIVKKSRALGLPAPVNRYLTEKIREIEQGYGIYP